MTAGEGLKTIATQEQRRVGACVVMGGRVEERTGGRRDVKEKSFVKGEKQLLAVGSDVEGARAAVVQCGNNDEVGHLQTREEILYVQLQARLPNLETTMKRDTTDLKRRYSMFNGRKTEGLTWSNLEVVVGCSGVIFMNMKTLFGSKESCLPRNSRQSEFTLKSHDLTQCNKLLYIVVCVFRVHIYNQEKLYGGLRLIVHNPEMSFY